MISNGNSYSEGHAYSGGSIFRGERFITESKIYKWFDPIAPGAFI